MATNTKTSINIRKLSIARINLIAWDIRDGNSDPKQTERLLQRFVEITEHGSPYNDAAFELLLQYLRYAFIQYLSGKQRIANALGLIRKRGRPKIRADRHNDIAVGVLRHMVGGKTLRHASTALASGYHIGANKIQDIWAANKWPAFLMESASRSQKYPGRKCQWSDAEINRIKKIYSREDKEHRAVLGRGLFSA